VRHLATGNRFGRAPRQKVKGNVPEWPNITFMVVMCRMPNINSGKISSNQCQASYTDVRHWEELID
jgi:hypothetical protein